MKEAAIEKKVVKWCKDHGILTYKFVSPAHRGVPDRIMMANGKVLFLELKTETGTLSPLQVHEFGKLLGARVPARVAFGYEKAILQLGAFFYTEVAAKRRAHADSFYTATD